MNRERPRLVYSTDPDSRSAAQTCPRCRRAPCTCTADPPPSGQRVSVRRERAGRRGKTVTVAGPLLLAPAAARDLLKALKQECGCGGTLKSAPGPAGEAAWELEIQGDHVERVVRRLCGHGFRARRAGG